MRKLWKWLCDSNRWQHLCLGLGIGLASDDWYCATLAGGTAATVSEGKDKRWGGLWDWIDFSLTLGGTFVGRALRMLLFN